MEVAPEFKVSPEMRAILTTAGITGLTFVDIGLPREGAKPAAPPKLSFTPPPLYIPSQPSVLTNLTSAVAEIASQMRGIDFAGLVADYRGLADAIKRRVAGPEVDQALQRIVQAADALDGLTRRASAFLEDPRVAGTAQRVGAAVEDLQSSARSAKTLLADPRLAETLGDLRAAAGGLRTFSEEMSTEAAALRVGERLDTAERHLEGALDGMNEAATRWKRTGTGVEYSLQDALTRIGRAADKLEDLAKSLEASPSRLLFEKPAKEDFR